MVSSRPGSISAAIRLRRDADSYECSRPGRALDRERSANLGRTAAHRVETEMTGMPGGGVEPSSVVANLEDDLALLSLDSNLRRARPGVLVDIGERFPRDREQLRLHVLG